MTPDVINPPPPPAFDIGIFNATTESLRDKSKSMVDTANSGQINQSFASNLADVFEGVFGLIGTLANVMNLVPDLVKKSSVNLIPNPSVLKQLGKLNMTEVNKTIQSVKQS